MEELIAQERFEIEVLYRLRSSRLLDSLVFLGGTMLRLCFGLERFSVDLDFWLRRGVDPGKLFPRLREAFARSYAIEDCQDKSHTMLFELRSGGYPRSLKVEIRKKEVPRNIRVQQAIAHSRYSNLQVLVRVVSPEDMMRLKVDAFLGRGEIRDAYDMEFLLRRGVELDAPVDKLRALLGRIEALTRRDYAVKLGSLLEEPLRRYYLNEDFRLLKAAIQARLSEDRRPGPVP